MKINGKKNYNDLRLIEDSSNSLDFIIFMFVVEITYTLSSESVCYRFFFFKYY
jgi:hypothetical protein